MNVRWVAACAVAEAIGITAAAAAARIATSLADAGVAAGWGFTVVVSGGVAEGAALGILQARSLPFGPGGDRAAHRWALVTIVVAGLGWAAGSAPATLAGDDGRTDPSPLLVILGAAAIGAAMGAVLGAAQAWAVRRRSRHPWRWVLGSTTGWVAAMPVIFLGATYAGAGWPWPAVVALGTATGLVAGTVLGVVTAPFLAALDGPPVRHRIVLAALGSPARHMLGDSLVGLAVVGKVSGRIHRFPVMAAPFSDGGLVVLPGHADRKLWWRNLGQHPQVEVLRGGQWRHASATILTPGQGAWAQARASYGTRFPRVSVTETDPLVMLRDTTRAEEAAGRGRAAAPKTESRQT